RRRRQGTAAAGRADRAGGPLRERQATAPAAVAQHGQSVAADGAGRRGPAGADAAGDQPAAPAGGPEPAAGPATAAAGLQPAGRAAGAAAAVPAAGDESATGAAAGPATVAADRPAVAA